ncbi:MAG: hypothetical protein RLZZ501_854 [Pseudomonadota bacterium]
MTALTADFDCPEIDGRFRSVPVAAGVVIYAGALVVLTAAGYAEPGTTATGLVALGRAESQVDNSAGAAGALNIRVRRGVFLWNNSTGADLIAEANIGAEAYIVDDNTVALTSATSTRSVAGKIFDIDTRTGGVWVEVI